MASRLLHGHLSAGSMMMKHSRIYEYKTSKSSAGGLSRGFTLIEMLVSISIIIILFAVGIPLMSDPSNSSRKSAADLLRGALQQARAQAVATGSYTSVLLPTYASDEEAGGRLIGIAELQADATVPAKYKVTQLVQRWTHLPEHIFFIDRPTAKILHNTIMDQGATPPIKAEYRKQEIDCNFIVFAPNGQILQNSANQTTPKLVVGLAKGTLKNGSMTPTQRNTNGIVLDLFQISRLSARLRPIER